MFNFIQILTATLRAKSSRISSRHGTEKRERLCRTCVYSWLNYLFNPLITMLRISTLFYNNIYIISSFKIMIRSLGISKSWSDHYTPWYSCLFHHALHHVKESLPLESFKMLIHTLFGIFLISLLIANRQPISFSDSWFHFQIQIWKETCDFHKKSALTSERLKQSKKY